MTATMPLARRFHAAGYSLYLVGGVVRDDCIGRAGTDPDLDCSTDARPEQIRQVIAGIADAVWSQGEEFGTIGCRVGDRIFEITTHRADEYEPGSRKPAVAFGDSIEDDLARRDFTVNAMALDLSDGAMLDPFGGRRDLEAGILRTPLDPVISFSEDPLRMLRAARFMAAFELTPVPELVSAVSEMVDRIEIVSVERIRDELEKLLMLDDVAAGFGFLVDTGLWQRLFPTVSSSLADRLARRVSAVEAREAERWAALVSLDGRRQLDELRLSNVRRAEIRWLLAIGPALTGLDPSRDRDLRELGAAVPSGELLERGVVFQRGLIAGDGVPTVDLDHLIEQVRGLRAREPDFDDPDLPLDGERVMEILGLDSGPEVGRAIEALRRNRMENGPLSEEDAINFLRGWRSVG